MKKLGATMLCGGTIAVLLGSLFGCFPIIISGGVISIAGLFV